MSWSLWWFLTRAEKQHKISLLGNYHFLVWIEPSKDVKNTFQTIHAINDYSKFIKLTKLTITKENIFFLHPNNTPEKSWRKLNQNSTTDMWNPDNIEIRLHPCSKRRQGRIYILSILVYTFWRRLPLYYKKKKIQKPVAIWFSKPQYQEMKKYIYEYTCIDLCV